MTTSNLDRFNENSIPALREMPIRDLECWLGMAKAGKLGKVEAEAIKVAEYLLSHFAE